MKKIKVKENFKINQKTKIFGIDTVRLETILSVTKKQKYALSTAT